MINNKLIQDNLLGLVGFRTSYDPNTPNLNTVNTESESGLYFNNISNFVSVKNIYDTQEYADISENDFNSYLTNEINEVILSLVKSVIMEQSHTYESCAMFPYEQDFSSVNSPGTGFVGVKIKPNTNKSVMLKIGSIAASFNAASTFYIYVFSSELRDRANYLYRQQVTTSANKAVKYNVNWDLSLSNESLRTTSTNNYNNLGGAYYIGYYEDDLSGASAYKRDFEASPVFKQPYNTWMEFGRYLLDGEKINPKNYDGLSDPYGLNLEYLVTTDFTSQIIQNKHLFARGIQLQMAERVINNILTTSRQNDHTRINKEFLISANYTLNDPKIGIRKQLEDEINTLKQSLFPSQAIRTSTLR